MAGEGRPVAYADVSALRRPARGGEDGVFECAWHQARFDRDSGERLDGPAPRDARLMRLSTIVEDNMLKYVWGE
jgi:nitrite reductase/ring-hydroxylating ferredoxin subunit